MILVLKYRPQIDAKRYISGQEGLCLCSEYLITFGLSLSCETEFHILTYLYHISLFYNLLCLETLALA